MERNQIIDSIHLVQWEIGVDSVRPWCAGNEPAATNPALEFVAIEGIGPVHNELEVVEFSPLAIADSPCRFV